MNLQFISDSTGKTTGVFIPIEEWKKLKRKFKGIGEEEIDLPKWHESVVKERLESYLKGNQKPVDFDTAIDEIEKAI